MTNMYNNFVNYIYNIPNLYPYTSNLNKINTWEFISKNGETNIFRKQHSYKNVLSYSSNIV